MITLICIAIVTISLLLYAAMNNDSFSEIFEDFMEEVKTPSSIIVYICIALIGVLLDVIF